ncbi:MAG TPA: hypothetical protein GX735_09275 [Firmicutes bacterium]|nr:hypothetical protein [Bacillota bacterium]
MRLPLQTWQAARPNGNKEPGLLPRRGKTRARVEIIGKAGTSSSPGQRKRARAGGNQDNPVAKPDHRF